MSSIIQLKDSSGNNIYPVAYASGGVKMDLLWVNDQPTTAQGAFTVTIDLSNYDLVYVTGMQVNTNADGYDSDVTRVGDKGILWSFVGGYTSHRMYEVKTTGVEFRTGSRQTSIGTNTDNTAYCIPQTIYGIKFSWVVPTSVQGLQYVEV